MSNPIDALRRYIDSSPSLVGLASPSGSYVKKEEMLEVIRLAELGQKVRKLECEPKDTDHTEHINSLSHEVNRLRSQLADSENNESMHQGRADAFLEALRLIVGVNP
jgi:hypothetical protein